MQYTGTLLRNYNTLDKHNQKVLFVARRTIGCDKQLKGNLVTGQAYKLELVLDGDEDMDTIFIVSDDQGNEHCGFWHEFTKAEGTNIETQSTQSVQPKLHLTQYLEALLGFPVGNIRLELEQPSEWVEYAFPTGQPLEQPCPMHGRLHVRLEFEAYTELDMGIQFGSLMVVKTQKVEAPVFQPSSLYEFRDTTVPRPFWRYTMVCLHGKETDSLFRYALGG